MIIVLCKAGGVEQACIVNDGMVDTGQYIPEQCPLKKPGNCDLAIKLIEWEA